MSERQPRLAIRKTYKLFIGGAFPRSESGRSYVVRKANGEFLANAALASRKDARDAVVAARKAFSGWSAATAYNRGQILYRIAEMLEGRRDQFIADLAACEGVDPAEAERQVDESIDRWVWYAGWSDKLAQVIGAANPVAGPYFDFSVPEPTGVVAVIAPQASSLLGLVSVVAPVIVTGNTCVVLAAESRPVPAITLAEVLATSDLPAGVVNILTGRVAEVAPWLAGHMDVNAIDLTGLADEPSPSEGADSTSGSPSSDNSRQSLAADLEKSAADNLKRVIRPPQDAVDWYADPGLARMTAFLETKTVWHPIGI
ncbi:MAG TPA: aldehyde dehydrogenase family protein [Actinopolymorphaceae bacterium]